MTPAIALDRANDLAPTIRAAAGGDRDAYASLVKRHARVVATIALSILREVPASEDVAQEVFVAAWQGLPRLKNTESFLPWLRQMTRNRSYKWIESRRRRREHAVKADGSSAFPLDAAIDGAPGAEAQLMAAQDGTVLKQALDALPDDSREILLLFYREGQSVRQVATLLGFSEDVAKKRLSRAREKLREDVLDRFGEAAARTVPEESFANGVLVALPTVAKASVSAMLARASAVLGSAGASAFIGALGSVGGIGVGFHASARRARDSSERRAIAAVGVTLMIMAVALAVTYSRVSPGLALTEGLVYVGAVVVSCAVVVPRIAARRMAIERATEPARARREAMIAAAAILLGTVGGVLAFLYAFLRR